MISLTFSRPVRTARSAAMSNMTTGQGMVRLTSSSSHFRDKILHGHTIFFLKWNQSLSGQFQGQFKPRDLALDGGSNQ